MDSTNTEEIFDAWYSVEGWRDVQDYGLDEYAIKPFMEDAFIRGYLDYGAHDRARIGLVNHWKAAEQDVNDAFKRIDAAYELIRLAYYAGFWTAEDQENDDE